MAAPTFVAAGTAAGGTGSATPGLPAGWAADDIHVMYVATSNEAVTAPAGWTQVTSSPQGFGSAGAGGSTRFTVLWRRAVGGDAAPTVADPGFVIWAQILGWRGCPTVGNPWDVTTGSVDSHDDGSNIPGDTTTVNDCLVVVAASDGQDVVGARWSGWTNADLGSLTERFDNGTGDGAGGGIGIATGTKATAGAFGSTYVSHAPVQGRGHNRAMHTIALKGASSMPTFVAAGTPGAGIGTSLPGLPAGWAADDIHLLYVETIASQAATAPAGWTQLPDSPQSVSSVSANTRLSVFWRRAVGGDAGPTVADSGDHTYTVIIGIRGCVTSGNPWDVTAGGTFDGRQVAIPSVTTTVTDTVVLTAFSHTIDITSSAQVGSWANSNLTSLTERADTATNSAAGAGFAVASGTMASPGAIGITTAQMESPAGVAYHVMALKSTTSVAGGGPRSQVVIIS